MRALRQLSCLMLQVFLLVVLVCLATGSGDGRRVEVTCATDDECGGCALLPLQRALESAVDGDVIFLPSGTFFVPCDDSEIIVRATRVIIEAGGAEFRIRPRRSDEKHRKIGKCFALRFTQEDPAGEPHEFIGGAISLPNWDLDFQGRAVVTGTRFSQAKQRWGQAPPVARMNIFATRTITVADITLNQVHLFVLASKGGVTFGSMKAHKSAVCSCEPPTLVEGLGDDPPPCALYMRASYNRWTDGPYDAPCLFDNTNIPDWFAPMEIPEAPVGEPQPGRDKWTVRPARDVRDKDERHESPVRDSHLTPPRWTQAGINVVYVIASILVIAAAIRAYDHYIAWHSRFAGYAACKGLDFAGKRANNINAETKQPPLVVMKTNRGIDRNDINRHATWIVRRAKLVRLLRLDRCSRAAVGNMVFLTFVACLLLMGFCTLMDVIVHLRPKIDDPKLLSLRTPESFKVWDIGWGSIGALLLGLAASLAILQFSLEGIQRAEREERGTDGYDTHDEGARGPTRNNEVPRDALATQTDKMGSAVEPPKSA